jgi:hypothetical protein
MKGRYAAAVGLVLAAAAIWPVAAKAEPPPPQKSLIADCQNAEKIDGKPNENSLASSGRQPKNCWMKAKREEDYYARPIKATEDFGNCQGKDDMVMIMNMTNTFEQRKGKYFAEQPGFEFELFKLVNIAWRKHSGTLDLKLSKVKLDSGAVIHIPPGYKAWGMWSQRMLKKEYSWVVEYGDDYHGRSSWEADDFSEGPLRIDPGDRGEVADPAQEGEEGGLDPRSEGEPSGGGRAEGLMDGVFEVKSEWCGSGDPPPGGLAPRGGTRPPFSDLSSSGSRRWDPETDGPLPE